MIVSSGGDVAALSAKVATSSIPIVTVSGSDPVKAGPVASFNRPGGNVTGASFVATELETKRLEILRDVAPTAAVIGVLINPSNPTAESRSKDLETLDHVDRLRRAFDLCRVNLAGCPFVFVSP